MHFALNDIKTDAGKKVTCLGLVGPFPDPPNGMLLSIDVTDVKKEGRASRIGEFLVIERIPHKDLESLTGRLSFSQTSIFGRFGRALIRPLYRKLYGYYYDGSISGPGRIILQWWSGLLKALRPRTIYPRKSSPDIVIFTDAATTTMIMASVVFRKTDVYMDGAALSCKG